MEVAGCGHVAARRRMPMALADLRRAWAVLAGGVERRDALAGAAPWRYLGAGRGGRSRTPLSPPFSFQVSRFPGGPTQSKRTSRRRIPSLAQPGLEAVPLHSLPLGCDHRLDRLVARRRAPDEVSSGENLLIAFSALRIRVHSGSEW